MGWQDRDYARPEGYTVRRPIYRGPGSSAYSVTTKIILANAIIYFLCFYTSLGESILNFGVMQARAVWHGQIWRLVTATYLHAGFMHLFFNMLFLYFLGPAIERRWGGREFFIVYTLAGIAGNVVLTAAGAVNFIDPRIPGLGASGSVMGLLAAAAVMFPHAEIYVYLLFPVRIRTFVAIYVLVFIFNIYTRGRNFGGDICHLTGVLVGLWWARSGTVRVVRPSGARGFWRPIWNRIRSTFTGLFRRQPPGPGFHERLRQRKADAAAIDRILAKVAEGGIQSLTPEEKRTLTQASDRMRRNEAYFGRTDRL